MKLDKRLVALINSKAGSGGGVSEETVTTMITAAINSLIDSAPEEYDTLGKVAAKLLLTDEQIQTIITQAADRYTKEETNELVSKIPKFAIEVVAELPTENISTTTVYLKTGSKSDPDNIYDEYIYVNSKWELLGTQKIDLTNFYTKEEINDLLNNKVDKVSGKTLSSNDYTTAEKNKLAGIATGANKTIVDAALSSTSTNPVQNQAVNSKCVDIDNCIVTNLIDTSKITSTTAYGVTRTNNGDGSISFVGTSSLSTDYFLVLMATTTLQAGTYTFTHNGVANSGSIPTVYQLYKNGKYLKGIDVSKPITIDADGLYGIGVAIKPGAATDCTYKPMLEKGVTAHNYVQYTGDTGTLNSDVANIVAKVNGTGWVEVDLSNTVFENNWCDITKSKLAYKRFGSMVSFHGSFLRLESAQATTVFGLTFEGLPPDDIVPEWATNTLGDDVGRVDVFTTNYGEILCDLTVWGNGNVQISFRSKTNENISGHTTIPLEVTLTYML